MYTNLYLGLISHVLCDESQLAKIVQIYATYQSIINSFFGSCKADIIRSRCRAAQHIVL